MSNFDRFNTTEASNVTMFERERDEARVEAENYRLNVVKALADQERLRAVLADAEQERDRLEKALVRYVGVSARADRAEACVAVTTDLVRRLVDDLQLAYDEDWCGADTHPTANQLLATLAAGRGWLASLSPTGKEGG
jgi:hypothetical protein